VSSPAKFSDANHPEENASELSKSTIPRSRFRHGSEGPQIERHQGEFVTASAPQVFQGVTPERYTRMVEKARSAGIPMDGNSGSAAKFGVEVAWSYSPETHELSIQCLRTPFFLNAGDVEAKIRTLVQQSVMA